MVLLQPGEWLITIVTRPSAPCMRHTIIILTSFNVLLRDARVRLSARILTSSDTLEVLICVCVCVCVCTYVCICVFVGSYYCMMYQSRSLCITGCLTLHYTDTNKLGACTCTYAIQASIHSCRAHAVLYGVCNITNMGMTVCPACTTMPSWLIN